MSDPHEMDKYLGNLRWNDLDPDQQELIGLARWQAAKLRPEVLTTEDLDDIARFVRLAQRRKAVQKKNGWAAS